MKKTIIAAAVAASVAAPAAFADVTVYGKLHTSLNDGEIGVNAGTVAATADGESMESNASRIGVKGSEDLGNGMSVFFLNEFGMETAEGTNGLTARDAYVGIDTGMGKLSFGRMAGATKAAAYNGNASITDTNSDADYMSSFAGKNDRHNNVSAYTNSFNGVDVTLAFAGNDTDDNFANTSIGVSTTIGGIKVAVANLNSDGNGKDETVVSAKGSFGDLTVGLIWDDAEQVGTNKIFNIALPAGDNDVETKGISTAYKMGNNVISVSYADVDADIAGTQVDGEATHVSFQHKLSKKSSVYVAYGDYEAKSGGTTVDGNNTSIGLIHSF